MAAPLVYAGHGWIIKDRGIDAYKGVDVRGKIVIVGGASLPQGVRFADLRGGRLGEDIQSPETYAARNGARAILRLPSPRALAAWTDQQGAAERSSGGGGSYRVARFAEAAPVSVNRPGGATPLPVLTPSPRMLEALFAGEKESLASVLDRGQTGAPGPAWDLAAGKTLDIAVRVRQQTTTTQNVVAVLEGSDPVLKNEYVALGAHYDHLGRAEDGGSAGEDRIYNGADDDGSGPWRAGHRRGARAARRPAPQTFPALRVARR
jgi:hypothetical protein